MKDGVDMLLGDPKKAMLAFMLPMVVSYLVSQTDSFMNAFWCSGLGVEATSSISTIAPVQWLMGAINVGLAVSATTTVAYYIGAGNKSKANGMASQAIVFGILASAIVSIILFVSLDPLIDFMGAGNIRESSKTYIMPYLLVPWAATLSSILAGLIRSEGATKKSMAVLVSSAAFHMILDPILIYSLGLGVAGAAWASCISSMLSVLIGLQWYHRGKMFLSLSFRKFRFILGDLKELLNIAVPRSAESATISVTDIFQRVFIIAVAGTAGVAVYTLTWRYVSLAMIPGMALGSALIPVCSAAYGHRDMDKARIAVDYAIKMTVLLCSILAVIVFIFADQLILIFSYTGDMVGLRPMLSWCLRAYCIVIPFFALISLGSSMLQTVRKSKKATVVVVTLSVLKLIMMGIGSLYSFEMVIWGLVLGNVFGGTLMITWARREVDKYISANRSAAF